MRLDQLEALFERWGGPAGAPGSAETAVAYWDPSGATPNPVFPWLASLWQGLPFEVPTQALPAMALLATDSTEDRASRGHGGAQLKIITYTLQVRLLTLGNPPDRGPAQAGRMLTEFYGWLDAIGDQIRGTVTDGGAKILVTAAHPDGIWNSTTGNGSVRFGEHFTMGVPYLRQENELLLCCDLDIVSEEQVQA